MPQPNAWQRENRRKLVVIIVNMLEFFKGKQTKGMVESKWA